MLGLAGELKHTSKGDTLIIETPSLGPEQAPCRYAYVFKVGGAQGERFLIGSCWSRMGSLPYDDKGRTGYTLVKNLDNGDGLNPHGGLTLSSTRNPNNILRVRTSQRCLLAMAAEE